MKRANDNIIAYLTLIISMGLEIVPLPEWALYLRPQMVFLFLIYWTLFDFSFGVVIAWIAGLILDLLTGTVFGQHALVFTVVIYVLIKLRRQAQYFPMLQQTMIIFILSMLNLALSYWIRGFSGLPPKTWWYWFPAVTTTLLWPVICWMLGGYRQKMINYID